MNNQTNLQLLNEKVSDILQKYHSLKSENEKLRIELVTIKSESEIKSQEIDRLIEQNSLKDLEIEEIVDRIESILG